MDYLLRDDHPHFNGCTQKRRRSLGTEDSIDSIDHAQARVLQDIVIASEAAEEHMHTLGARLGIWL